MSNEIIRNVERTEIARPVFVLLLGPSGAGKSSIIRNLTSEDERFKFVSPITDRPLRPGETEKISVSHDAFSELENSKFFLVVNKIYNNRYGTPRSTIDDILKDGNIPILDFPMDKLGELEEYKDILFKVYITPPTLGTLKRRLEIDGRSEGNTRYEEARSELLTLVKAHFAHPDIDNVVINRNLEIASAELLELVYNRIS